jgi:hypothetical protein
MKSYPPDTKLRFSVTFTSALDGSPADPDDVILTLRHEDDPIIQFTYGNAEVVRDGVGLYHYDYQPTDAGDWRNAWKGTGSVVAATFDTPFRIFQSALI